MSITVLIADDHPVFREGLSALFSSSGQVQVVGEASTGPAAVATATDLLPDVVVMDLHMPDLNGIEATRRISETCPSVGVLVLTMFRDDDSVFAAMQAGARGYLLKNAVQDDILRAVRSVAAGEAVFGAEVAARVMAFFQSARPMRMPAPFPELTDREREVLELIARGLANDAIAATLFISGKTLKNHISNIFSKLHLADRAEAIVRAREAGLASELPKDARSGTSDPNQ